MLFGRKMPDLLAGYLSENHLVRSRLEKLVWDGVFEFGEFMKFAYEHKSSHRATWNAQDWLCSTCISSIAESYLHLWLFEMESAEISDSEGSIESEGLRRS